MSFMRRPSYITVQEWNKAKKRLPLLRAKYKKAITGMSPEDRRRGVR